MTAAMLVGGLVFLTLGLRWIARDARGWIEGELVLVDALSAATVTACGLGLLVLPLLS